MLRTSITLLFILNAVAALWAFGPWASRAWPIPGQSPAEPERLATQVQPERIRLARMPVTETVVPVVVPASAGASAPFGAASGVPAAGGLPAAGSVPAAGGAPAAAAAPAASGVPAAPQVPVARPPAALSPPAVKRPAETAAIDPPQGGNAQEQPRKPPEP